MIRYLIPFSVLTTICIGIRAETIPAIMTTNTKIDTAYTLNSNPSIMEKTWQGVCDAIGLPPTDVPGGMWCVNHSGNPVYVQGGDICADGSFKVPMDFGWCEAPVVSCPNFSWTLSEDKKTCSRLDFSCIIKPDEVSEEKLLAAIAYGESSVMDNYEEMAGIAYATIRRRDAAKMPSVQTLIKKYPSFSFVVSDGNPRYRKLMCSDTETNFENAYNAARNAIDKGIDYANGGCFWDGYDLKTSGSKHYKYRHGFQFSNPEHNIFSVDQPSPKGKKTKMGMYDHEYDSVAAHGKTIFWILNKEFLKARGKKQCQ